MIDCRANYPSKSFDERVDEPIRIYTINGRRYPSVTTFISETKPRSVQMDKWVAAVGEEEAKRQAASAARNGTRAHAIFQKLFTCESVNKCSLMPDDIERVNSISKLTTRVQEVWASEHFLVSDELQLAGTCDWVGVLDTICTLADLKTCRSELNDMQLDEHGYWLQTAIYARMWEEQYHKSLERLAIIELPTDRNDSIIYCRNNVLDMDNFRTRRQLFKQKHGF